MMPLCDSCSGKVNLANYIDYLDIEVSKQSLTLTTDLSIASKYFL